MDNLPSEPRTEAERLIVHEAGGLNELSLAMIFLMRGAGMSCYNACAIIRAVKFASIEGNVPDVVIGSMYRNDLVQMLEDQ